MDYTDTETYKLWYKINKNDIIETDIVEQLNKSWNENSHNCLKVILDTFHNKNLIGLLVIKWMMCVCPYTLKTLIYPIGNIGSWMYIIKNVPKIDDNVISIDTIDFIKDWFIEAIVSQIRVDIYSNTISDCVKYLPREKSKSKELYKEIAYMTFPNINNYSEMYRKKIINRLMKKYNGPIIQESINYNQILEKYDILSIYISEIRTARVVVDDFCKVY
jgi:hypothetical protein